MLITKSKFLIGLKCPRCFWKSMHEKVLNELSLQEKQIIKQGIQIGDLAKNLFDKAMDLSNMEFRSNIDATKDCLFLNHVIFEAGFIVDDLYARIDILVPNTDKSWDIVEVKSGTKVKDEHIYDVAFQKYVCERAGISINKCHLLHLNGSYVKEGQINLNELFVKENISDKVEEFYNKIPQLIEELMKIYKLLQAPVVNANKYLANEYPCQFDSECWSILPKDNASKLYKLRKSKAAELFKNNIFEMSKVPDEMLNVKQRIQKNATRDNTVYRNKDGIKSFIDKLQYPLYYLDFETFMEPVPRFLSCKVYAQIPFQYSLHIQYENGTLKHYEFLHKDATDPRKSILISMLHVLGDKGSIVVFNQAFEKSRLKELAELYPEYKASVDRILERVVDLLVPFSGFNYYNPIQQGSCSIKKVLPAVTGKSYEGMEIGNGGDASTLYFKATFENEFSSKKKQKIYSDLLVYCKLDTEGMVWIVDELKNMIK